MGYSIFLDGVRLPVSTDKLGLRQELASEEYDIIGTGKVQTPSGRELMTIEFKTEFPARQYGYVDTGSWEEPGKLLAQLRALQEKKSPFRFVAVGEEEKLTMTVTLESLTAEELATEDGDYTVSVKLREYRSFGAVATALPKLPRPGVRPISNTLVVREGETLQNAAARGGAYLAALEKAGTLGARLFPTVANAAQVEELKPYYVGAGQLEFDTGPVVATIDQEKVKQGVGNLTKMANQVGSFLDEQIQAFASADIFKNVPR